MERLNSVVAEVGRRDGIANFRLSADGTAAIEYKGGVQVFFEYVKPNAQLFIYTPLFDLPDDPEQRLSLLETLLACNFLKAGKGRGEPAIFHHLNQAVFQIGMDEAKVDTFQLDQAIDELLERRHWFAPFKQFAASGRSLKSLDRNIPVHSARRLMIRQEESRALTTPLRQPAS